MEKKVVLALVLSMIVIIGYQHFFMPKIPVQPPDVEQTETTPPVVEQKAPVEAGYPPVRATDTVLSDFIPHKLPDGYSPKKVVVDSLLYKAVFSELDGKLISFKLKKYAVDMSKESPLVDVCEGLNEKMGTLLVSSGISGRGAPNFNIPMQADKKALNIENNGYGELVFKGILPNGLAITKSFYFSDSYLIKMNIELENITDSSVSDYLVLALFNYASADKSRYSFEGPIVYDSEKIHRVKEKKIQEQPSFANNINWYGYEYKYFLSIVMDGIKGGRLSILPLSNDKKSSDAMQLWSSSPFNISPGAKFDFPFDIFVGPKDLPVLKEVGKELDKIVNFGWFDVIAKPLLWTLKFFYQFVKNYGVSIIIVTILIKIIFWPLTHKSTISMQKMQKLQPLMAKVKEKYKDDRQLMNQELMRLYKTYKVNPMGGCLPMLLQIPVFFALYKVLLNDITLRHAPFISHIPFTDIVWLADLSAKDPFYITPVIMGASMFLQQKTMPTPGDPTQAKIMLFMPIVFTFFFLNFPSGLVLYWMINNFLSIGQQYYIKHKFTD